MSINKNDKEEFIGQIIDLFEDFLDEKNVKISNPEAVEDGEENIAIIYGGDYDTLHDQIQSVLENWDIIPESKQEKQKRKCRRGAGEPACFGIFLHTKSPEKQVSELIVFLMLFNSHIDRNHQMDHNLIPQARNHPR